jgi:16S rRNA U516 pseudouridylate synthase RsuA-like enzyme
MLPQGVKVDPARDKITLDGQHIALAGTGGTPRQLYYIALNKPKGYVCSNVSTKPGKRAVDLLQPWIEVWQARQTRRLEAGRVRSGKVTATAT